MRFSHILAIGAFCLVVTACTTVKKQASTASRQPAWVRTKDVPMVKVSAQLPIRAEGETNWYRGEDLWVEGRAWNDTKSFWNRLPASAEGRVTSAVWRLQSNTAGMAVRFSTEAKQIRALWSGGGAMNHMPATGMSGLDLYRRTAEGTWQWCATGVPAEKETTVDLWKNQSGDKTEYLLFLPLYHDVTRLEIGIDKNATIDIPTKISGPPIVFYGTSITQGGCASRTGMAHPAILRRWLDREVVNLGFSGSGRMEPAMEELLEQLDASVYILDCVPNMTNADMVERFEPFIRNLRKARPDTPILLVSHIIASMGQEQKLVLIDVRNKLRAEGMKKIYYIDGPSIIKGDEEGTVDGVHPTDLGFERMAHGFRPVLEAILSGDESKLDWE